LTKHLTDRTEAAAYLDAAAEEGDLKILLKALRNVVEAQGGIGSLAKKTKLARTTLYKTLSTDGNPEVMTLGVVLKVYGIRIGFFPTPDVHRHAA
jgi:probable addiction module antidote protein